MLKRLGSYPRQNGLALALREIGRIERTLFTLDWLEDPELRRQATAELNKGEARNALARAVCFHRLGRLRDRAAEAQQHRASGLALVTAAIALWNTVYLDRAIQSPRRQEESVPEELLAHLAPVGWQRDPVLTWQNRITRALVRQRDLFGQWSNRWTVIRTSNAYVFRDPQLQLAGVPAAKSENRSGTQNQEILTLVQKAAPDLNSPLERALARFGAAFKERLQTNGSGGTVKAL